MMRLYRRQLKGHLHELTSEVAIIHSPFSRTAETAACVANELELNPALALQVEGCLTHLAIIL